jgi:manganese/zinc/iron transport system permease protein
MNDLYIIGTASAIAISCALIGSFLVLRQMAMIGDAISHAVLPGIVLAYLFAGNRDSLTMLLGAVAIGVLATMLIEVFHKKTRLQEDAAIGVTFTWLFALGVILISVFTGQVDLDQDCVLYGEIAYVPLDLWFTNSGINLGPRPLWVAGGLLLLVLIFVLRGYRGLFVTSFNPEFAAGMGISIAVWHYALMGMVSVTTVISFESVGAILVVALLIAPAAAAYLLTDKLPQLLVLASTFGVLSSILGYYLAKWLDGSIAGAISTVAGVIFIVALMITRFRQAKKRAYSRATGSFV